GGEVFDLEPYGGDVCQHQSGLQHEVLAQGKSRPYAVELVDESVNLLPGVDLFPLRDGNTEKQVGVGEDGSTRVQADKDVEHPLKILSFFLIVIDQVVGVHHPVEAIERRVGELQGIALEATRHQCREH